MTVTTRTSSKVFIGNGVAKVMPFTFRFFKDSDLKVSLIDIATGAETPLAQGVDYSVQGAGNQAGGSVTLTAALPLGKNLSVRRVLDLVQLTDLVNQGKFFPEIHENAFDYLTMLIQQTDAETADISARSLRTPESIKEMPDAKTRAGKLVAFDADGQPTIMVPAVDSSLALAMALADPAKGAGMVASSSQSVGTIADLRKLKKSSPSKFAETFGYHTKGDGGGGIYWLDESDASSVDNGVTVHVAGDGGRWKLNFKRAEVHLSQAGAVGDGITDDSDAIQRALYALGEVTTSSWISGGCTLIATPRVSYLLSKALVVPLNVSIDWNFSNIVPSASFAGGAQGAIFYLNAEPSTGAMITDRTGDFFPEIKRLFVLSDQSQALRVFWSKSKHAIRDAVLKGISQVYVRTGSTNAEYIDQAVFERINISNAVGSDYMFDIGYHGDGLKFDQVHIYSSDNMRLLKLDRCRGGVISRSINGDYLFSRCTAIDFEGFHIEVGSIVTQSSHVSLRDGQIWNNNYHNGAPIVVGEHAAEFQSAPVVVDNVTVIYPRGRTGLPDEFGSDKADMLVSVRANVDIRSFTRNDLGSTTITRGRFTAAKVAVPDNPGTLAEWGRFAPLVARSSFMAGGKVRNIPSVYLDPPSPTPNLTVSAQTDDGSKVPSGTYYYRAQLIFGDVNRLCGVQTSETSVTVADSNTRVILVSVPSTAIGDVTLCTMRVYRGTTSGQYTHYVDVPCFGDSRFHDLWYRTATGEAWKSRTAGGADSINSFTSLQSIAERASIKKSSAPTYGVWAEGDECITATSVLRYVAGNWV